MSNLLQRLFRFYYDGFRSMTVGRTLWIMILIKLTIMFLTLRIFFFPNFLKTNFETDEARSQYVLQELTRQRK